MDELAAPADVLPRWLAAMRCGDFEEAWRQTDRSELPRRAAEVRGEFARRAHHLVWNGASFHGQRVLVRCEHGLGDSIQFLRYAPVLRERASRVIVKAQPALLPLLVGIAGIDELRDAWTTEPDPAHDVEIECMELAYAFRSTLETLPADVPYLPVERILQDARGLSIDRCEARVAGLIWSASSWDTSRSIRLTQLAPLGEVAGWEFASLQQGPEREEVRGASFPVAPLSEQTSGILEAAAAMLTMDLVITVDSMTAHLAGALGRPAWVLLQHAADWRWMEQRAESPWYPTMRLFRQPMPGAWGAAIAEMVAALASLKGSTGERQQGVERLSRR